MKYPFAMSIAGSDSGGGAGIEADLKTFSALGVYGTIAVTSVTAQNTYEVTRIVDIPPEAVVEQVLAVHRDIGIDAFKTGMLHNAEVIEAVSKLVDEIRAPYVLDPVMIAKSGARLLREDAVETLIHKLLPKATVATPNRFEAEVITGMEIRSVDDAVEAAKEIIRMGVESVVVKGGHLGGEMSIDVLHDGSDVILLSRPRIDTKATHGTGCSFSAAITAYLAKGMGIRESVEKAKDFITISIMYGLEIGRGSGPVNPMATLYGEASKPAILRELHQFVRRLESIEGVYRLIPEVGMNIAYSTEYAYTHDDVAAFPGRIRYFNRLIYEYPEFGASRHLSSYILTARRFNRDVRAAVNIRFEEGYLEILREKGYVISFFNRMEEPEDIKRLEGRTIPWGVETAIKRIGRVPDVIFHRGDLGKEPMIVFLGRDLDSVFKFITIVAGEDYEEVS